MASRVLANEPTNPGLDVRRVRWDGPDGFRRWWGRNFHAGEHVFVVGKTGSGKSFLLRELVTSKPSWDWIILDAKGGLDPSLQLDGFRTGHDWPPREESPATVVLDVGAMRRWFQRAVYGHDDPVQVRAEPNRDEPKRIHFAPPKLPDAELRAIFGRVLDDLRLRGAEDGFDGIVFDEGNTLAGMPNDGGLGLYSKVSPLFRTKRFEQTSLVVGTQYPSWVPRSLYSEVQHRFFFRVADEDRRKRIAEVAGHKEVAAIIPTLGRHEFLYQHDDRDVFMRSRVT